MAPVIHDYIVVGAGAAGCVLAERLSADPSVSVLLLEYGGTDRHPLHRIPKGFYLTMGRARYAYHYETLPIGPDAHREVWIRGKVVGGSTTVNGMMYVRGFAADYDDLEARGNPGWGWRHLLPIFRKIEDHRLGPGPTRGVGGPYAVSAPVADDELTEAVVAGSVALGLKRVADVNGEDIDRIGGTPSSIHNGRRVSAATAFLRPALRRPNLTCARHTRAVAVDWQGTRAVGVRAVGPSGPQVFAGRQTILCAGTVETPMLLERSGVGDPQVLSRAGITVVVESTNVGNRVLEQRKSAVQFRVKAGLGLTQQVNSPVKRAVLGARYLVRRRGPLATGGLDLTCGFTSAADVDRPDAQGMWGLIALDPDRPGLHPAPHAGLLFEGYPLRPTTSGSIHVSSPEVDAPPVIDARFLQSAADLRVAPAVVRHARAVAQTGPLADLVLDEDYPRGEVTTDEQLVRWALETGTGVYHAVGSAAMGPGDDDVVDARLQVRGTEGLRIADASVFPVHPAGNMAAPTMALAWRAAELITEER